MPESQGDIHADFRRSQKWKDELYKSVCHKSVDIPEDDVTITQHGITGKHLVALAGIALLGLLGWRALMPSSPEVPQIVGAQAAPAPAVQEYEVSFWAEDGTEIEVEGPE